MSFKVLNATRYVALKFSPLALLLEDWFTVNTINHPKQIQ